MHPNKSKLWWEDIIQIEIVKAINILFETNIHFTYNDGEFILDWMTFINVALYEEVTQLTLLVVRLMDWITIII